MSEKINIGDTVDVHFSHNTSIFGAKVLYTPAATGDCWTLETPMEVYAVQQYEYMVKVKSGIRGLGTDSGF